MVCFSVKMKCYIDILKLLYSVITKISENSVCFIINDTYIVQSNRWRNYFFVQNYIYVYSLMILYVFTAALCDFVDGVYTDARTHCF